jgi:hypothetical protein
MRLRSMWVCGALSAASEAALAKSERWAAIESDEAHGELGGRYLELVSAGMT